MNKSSLYILVAIVVVSFVGLTATIMHTANEQIDLQKTSQKQEVIVEGLLPPFTTDDLAKRSKYIILGKVSKIETTQPVIDKIIGTTTLFSDVTIDVEQDLTGQYNKKQIIVRIEGGENEKLIVTSNIDARFYQRERVLVFVADKEPNSVWGNNYYVAGLLLGKYNLDGGKAYGPEAPVGIDESKFITKVKTSRNI